MAMGHWYALVLLHDITYCSYFVLELRQSGDIDLSMEILRDPEAHNNFFNCLMVYLRNELASGI